MSDGTLCQRIGHYYQASATSRGPEWNCIRCWHTFRNEDNSSKWAQDFLWPDDDKGDAS
jgi:hypothetical protein